MDERPTIEIVLPLAKARVILYQYLRNGDFRNIQRRLADTIKFKVETLEPGQKPTPPEFSGGAAIMEQDYTLELLTKEIIDAAGNPVTNIADFYYNIRREDGDLLYAKANELNAASRLTDESKKK